MFRSVFFEHFRHFGKTLGPCFNVLLRVEALFDYNVHKSVQNGNVCSGLDLQVYVGKF